MHVMGRLHPQVLWGSRLVSVRVNGRLRGPLRWAARAVIMPKEWAEADEKDRGWVDLSCLNQEHSLEPGAQTTGHTQWTDFGEL